MQPQKLSLVSLVAGVVMFFLPWIEVQCQGRGMLRQSGVEVALGKITVSPDITQGIKQPQEGKGDAGLGYVVIAAGIFTLLALKSAWSNVQDDVHEPAGPGRLAAIALALIASQMIFGFPIERNLRDEMKKMQKPPGAQSQEMLEAALQQQIAAAFQIKFLPSLYLCLAALAVPALQWLTAARKKPDESESPFTSL